VLIVFCYISIIIIVVKHKKISLDFF